MIMKKKTTGSFTSRFRRIMLAWFFGTAAVLSAYAQGSPSCSDVDLSDLTINPATCEGNGKIIAPDFDGAAYTLTGVNYNVGPQDSGTFPDLSPGTYTLTVLCEGSTTPVEITGVVVPNNWQQLALALTPAITCPGQGTMTAVASFGFNKGGAGATYEFAIWQGSAGASDGSLTWVSPGSAPLNQHIFTGLATGNYNVRVRDNCGNIWTESKSIGSANAPTADLGRNSVWVCENGQMVKRVTLNLATLPVAARFSGYKYKVDFTSGNLNCNTQPSLGTIVPETEITSTNAGTGTLPPFDIVNIPPTATYYRVTTTSPCGGVSYACVPLNQGMPSLSFARTYASCADPNSASTTRLTYIISPNEYTFTYPATLILNGQGGWTQTITIANASGLTGVVDNVPLSAYSITGIVTNCSNIATATTTAPGNPGGNAPAPGLGYEYTCVDFDHVNLVLSFNGAYVGVGQAGTVYKLYNAADDTEVATGTLTDPISNKVTFPNVLAEGSYYVKITPPAVSGCSEQQTANVTLPLKTTPNYAGARIVVAPSISQNCTEQTSMWDWNYGTNNFTAAGRVTRFRVWKVGDSPVTGPFVRDVNYNATSFAIEPGEYLWSMTNDYPDDDCDRSVTATEPIVVGAVQWAPTVQKSVTSTCQDENGQPLTTGTAILEYAGNGPFLIEQRDAAGSVNSWVTVPGGTSVVATTFTINNLEAGKTYIFRITDRCGRSVTQQASVKPLSPRIISKDAVQPCVNQDYVLQGIDYPGATYTWTKVGGGVVSNTRDLSFSPFTAADAGQYKLTLQLGNCAIRETTITLGTNGCGQPFQLGSLGNFVWYDTDYDGMQDPGEAPAPGVSVTLQGYVGPNPSNPSAADLANNANWSDMETQLTDASGLYKFTDLEGGYYRVRFGDVADYTYTGYQQGASDPDNRGEGGDSNANPANGNYSGPVLIEVNHPSGDVRRDNMTIDAGLVRYGSIGDYVWFDTDLDGIQDAGEPPVKDVTVNLWIKDGETWVSTGRTTTTDAAGKYLFDNLKPGTYQVEFVKPAGNDFTLNYVGGASSTAPTDSDANRTTGKSGEIVIDVSLPKGNVGRDNMTIDAGLVPEGALPVKLSRFSAEKTTEGAALLTWATTEEKNSAYFDVLQSVDATNWQAIGRVEAGGNSLTTAKYSFTDFTPAKGVNYYRLKMVDLDGSFDHSNIRSLTFEGTPLDLSVYPNPVSDRFSIKVGAREKISKVELFDSNGRRAIVSDRYTAGESIISKGLSAGTYVLKVTMNNGAVEIRKIVISNK